MTITLTPEIEIALTERAQSQGTEPEALALDGLRTLFLQNKPTKAVPLIAPRDDWERRLANIGTDCGVSLSNEALSSDGLYED